MNNESVLNTTPRELISKAFDLIQDLKGQGMDDSEAWNQDCILDIISKEEDFNAGWHFE